MKVIRPERRADMCLRGLRPFITPAEVIAALAEIGGCPEGDIRVGEIRRFLSGVGSVWTRCPWFAASKIANRGKISVGWSTVTVDLLPGRPLQCYLMPGHVG